MFFVSLIKKAQEKRASLFSLSNAYRIFNGVADGFPGITLDRFGNKFQVQVFASIPEEKVLDFCESVLTLFDVEFLVVKYRKSPAGKELEHPEMKVIVGDNAKEIVFEGKAKFAVDLLNTVNPGLFLDMRDARLDIEERIRTGRFLNLFSYTCSFSVHARLGGASLAANADISGKILEKGKENYCLNNLEIQAGEFFRGNALEYVRWALKKGLKFDGIVLDPPSFARFKGFYFNVKNHLFPLVQEAAPLLNKGGFFMVSSNYSEFVLDRFKDDVLSAVKKVYPQAKTVWKKTQGIDFPHEGKVKESSLVATLVEV